MKRLLLSLAIAIIANTVFSQNNIDSGLVGYFPFAGNATNKGSGVNGINYGASLTTDRFNNPKSAYSFNGSSNYIDLQNAYDNVERSVSFWFNTSLIETTARVIYVSDYANVVNGCTAVNVINSGGADKITFAVGYQRAEAPMTVNTWHHVLIIRSAGYTKIYMDCFELSQTTAGAAHSVDGLSTTIVGSSRHANNNYFKGTIDDIRIYDRALSTQEAKVLCSEGNPCDNFMAKDPGNATAKGGATAGFWTSVNQTPISYQWQINTGNGFSNVPNTCFYSGANTLALGVNLVGLSMDKNAFRCIVATDQCIDTTAAGILNVDSVGNGHDTVYMHDTTYVHDSVYVNTTDTLFIQFKLGINLLDQLTVKIFPNPANDHLYIDFGNFQYFNTYSISIVNTQSQQVYNSAIIQQTASIDLSSWTGAGVYFVTLKDNNGNALVTKKIVLK
jgi:hypothetical protein